MVGLGGVPNLLIIQSANKDGTELGQGEVYSQSFDSTTDHYPFREVTKEIGDVVEIEDTPGKTRG